MPRIEVNGLSIAYEIHGDSGRHWTLTPGGRFSMDFAGVRELAKDIAAQGNTVLMWDRPNCGQSEVCFTGPNESQMQADTLAALVKELDFGPVVISGGSGGSRISLLTARALGDLAEGLAIWWISGGIWGLMGLAQTYCGTSVPAAWNGGMEAVADLPVWEEVTRRYAPNRDRFLALDPLEFIDTMERWMHVYCACDGSVVPGLPNEDIAKMTLPALVFRSGASDPNHPRVTSEQVAELLPNAQLVEPPWQDTAWLDGKAMGGDSVHKCWPQLAPQLHEWAEKTLPKR